MVNRSNSPKRRESSIELLRIIAILMIIAFHLFYHSDLTNYSSNDSIAFIISFMSSFGKVGVSLFFIISGYHMAQSKSFEIQKILPIAYKTWFYSFAIFFTLFIVKPFFVIVQTSSSYIISSFFPIVTGGYWFVSQFIVIRLLYPYMRRWFDQMSDSDLFKLFCIFTISLVLPSIITMPLGGYTKYIFILPEAFYYSFLGYFIYRYKTKFTTKIALITLCISLASLVILPLVGVSVSIMQLITSSYFPLCIALSMSIFRLFLNVHFTSKIINYLGGLVFSIYLIHDNNYIRKILWQDTNSIANSLDINNSLNFFLQSIAIVFSIFIICALIEAIRQLIVHQAIKLFKYNQKKIKSHPKT